MYVIVRSDGAFVARSGSRGSYTDRLQDARVFANRESAERERCPGNECVVPMSSIMRAL